MAINILEYPCERCKRLAQLIAIVTLENGMDEEVCPVCLEELKAQSHRQVQAGPSEVKNGA